jgi:predicted 2-oxoglutarate/Fe(II)-dependent dioxygenase YbiX
MMERTGHSFFTTAKIAQAMEIRRRAIRQYHRPKVNEVTVSMSDFRLHWPDLKRAVAAKCRTNEDFRRAVLANPRQAITAHFGVIVPAEIRIKVEQELPSTIYVTVPPQIHPTADLPDKVDASRDGISSSMEEILPGVIKVGVFAPREAISIARSAAVCQNWSAAAVMKDGNENSIDASVRSADVLMPAQAPEIFGPLESRLAEAVKVIASALTQMQLTPTKPQIVRYRPGQYYHPHRDNSGERSRRRYISLVCFLNDDFEGGATYFSDLQAGARVPPGSAILFQSGRLHAGAPVTNGEKFVLVLWLLGPELPLTSGLDQGIALH